MITHGSAGDAFWDVVQNGADAAGEDLGVSVDYQSDGEPQRQAQLIDAAVNQGVDGIVVSMANPDAVQDSVEAAVDAGIPVVTINSGGDRSAEFGAIGHVGQDEPIAGQGAGRAACGRGGDATCCACVHEAGNIGLEQRCSGASDGLGSEVSTLQVDINDLQGAQSTITSQLQSDPAIDAVLTLNSAVAALAVSGGGRRGRRAPDRHVRSQRRCHQRHPGRRHRVRRRPAAVRAGLPADRDAASCTRRTSTPSAAACPSSPGRGSWTQSNVDEIADLASAGTR